MELFEPLPCVFACCFNVPHLLISKSCELLLAASQRRPTAAYKVFKSSGQKPCGGTQAFEDQTWISESEFQKVCIVSRIPTDWNTTLCWHTALLVNLTSWVCCHWCPCYSDSHLEKMQEQGFQQGASHEQRLVGTLCLLRPTPLVFSNCNMYSHVFETYKYISRYTSQHDETAEPRVPTRGQSWAAPCWYAASAEANASGVFKNVPHETSHTKVIMLAGHIRIDFQSWTASDWNEIKCF